MIDFAFYWDGGGTRLRGETRIALEYGGSRHSLRSLEVHVPCVSEISTDKTRPSFMMVGRAVTIEIDDQLRGVIR